MPVKNSPASLESQCIQSIGTFVSQMFSSCLPCVNLKPMSDIEATCLKLKGYIYNYIPFVLANSVTHHLLRRLDDSPAFRRDFLMHDIGRKIIHLFVNAVLHPESTVLEITWQWRFIGDFVHLEMGHLFQLKSLKLCESDCFDGDRNVFNVAECLKKFVFLEQLTLQSKCTDEVLEAISSNCPRMKHLDINGSVTVSDASVGAILKFDNLQTLDVTHTGLSDTGRTQILLGLSAKATKSLKNYACNHISNTEMGVLVNHFPNLNTLSVRFINININLEVLKRFNNLQVFKTDNYLQHFHRQLVQIVGRNLVELQLVGYTINAQVLADNCPLLVTLSLKMDSIQFEVETSLSFDKLKHLTLVTNDAPGTALFLICCPNLISLQLITVPEFYTQFHLEMVVLKNPLKYLREFAIGSLSKDLPTSTIWFIVIHWNLLSCKVLLNNSTNSEHYREFPGVRVDCDLWMKITQRVHFFSDLRRKPKKQNYSKGLMRRLYRHAKTIQ